MTRGQEPQPQLIIVNKYTSQHKNTHSPSTVIIIHHNPYYFSKPNVMYQKNTHNNARIKEGFFPTPQTRIEERHSFDHNEGLCLAHPSSALQLICMSCDGRPVCPQCFSAHHSGHDVRGLQRVRQSIYSQYQEWMIHLWSKSEILDIIHGQFENNKCKLNQSSMQYKERLTNQFAKIITFLQSKLEELHQAIDANIRKYLFQMNNLMENIRAKRKDIEKILDRYEKDHIEDVPLPELAAYSYDIRHTVHDFLQDADILNYKEQLVEREWGVNADVFKDVKTAIDSIAITFKQSAVRQPKPSQAEQEKPKKRSRKELKLMEERERSENKLKQSASSTPFVQATLTPKNKSKEKKIKQKRSPEVQLLKKRKKSSAKMISMPASPAKEVESTYLITPELSRKKLFKKK